MRDFNAAMLGLALATALMAATPAAAVTHVRFSFTAGGTPVHGVFTLDCPPGSGPCAILDIAGFVGTEPVAKTPDPPPAPPNPNPPVSPDNILMRPSYRPTSAGFDFWGDVYFVFTEEQEEIWRMYAYEREQAEAVEQYLVTDYEASVPEPSTWALLLTGFLGVGAGLRRTRRATTPRPI